MGAHRPYTTATLRAHSAYRREDLFRELRQVVRRRVDADIVGADTTRESAQRADDTSAQRIDDSIVQHADDSSDHLPQAGSGNGRVLLHLPLPSPADDYESERRFGACCVCMSRSAGVAFIDCGHLCTCVKCALKLHARKDKCPLCRRPIKAILRVWAGCEV